MLNKKKAKLMLNFLIEMGNIKLLIYELKNISVLLISFPVTFLFNNYALKFVCIYVVTNPVVLEII